MKVIVAGPVGLLAFSIVLAACSEADRTTAVYALSELPALEFVETAALGGALAEGVNALGRVRGASLIPGTDHLVIVDGFTQELRFFTRSGLHVRTVGRRGGGPGESQALSEVWGAPDGGVCTWDIQQTRVTGFDGAGTVVGTGRADLSSTASPRPSFVGFLEDCSFLLRDRPFEMGLRDDPEGMRRDTVRILLFNPTGSLNREVTAVPDAERWFRNREGSWGHVVPIFGQDLVSFVSGDALWVGLTGAFRWTRFHLESGVVDTVWVETLERPSSSELIDAERETRIAAVVVRHGGQPPIADGQNLYEIMAEQERAGIREAPSHDRVPAYDHAVPGQDGWLWIREYPLPSDDLARWVLLSSDGSLQGQVRLPRDEEVLAANRNWLLVLKQDEMDAPVVLVLRRVDAP